ncbi:MAG: rhodanese-like domain-containing protein [Crocinitomicaceae bacterium]
MGIFSSLFGKSKKQDQIIEMLTNGGIIIDVRNPGEFKSGHVKGSKNIPLNVFASKVNEIKKLNKPVILCCASGMRSANATATLKKAGVNAINGGGWRSLQ